MQKKIEAMYEENIAKKGTDPALGYPEGTKEERMSKTAALIEQVAGKLRVFGDYTVLDVGCGYADLYNFLQKPVEYTGIEQMDWIANEARVQNPDIANRIHHGNIMEMFTPEPKYDVVVGVGVLACLSDEEDEAFRDRLFNACKPGGHVILSFIDKSQYDGFFRGLNAEYVYGLYGVDPERDPIMVSMGNHITFAVKNMPSRRK